MSDLADRHHSDLLLRLARIDAYLGPMTDAEVNQLVADVQDTFATFGGDRKGDGSNPLTHWNEGHPATFALGVDVQKVVRFLAIRMHEIRLDRPPEP